MLSLVDKTPYEAWTSKRPSLAHRRVFVCDSFVHIPKERRKNLNNKLKKCIFIGFQDGIKGQKLWNPSTRIAIYSRDVIFREVERTSKVEDVKREKEPENIEF